jgi:hypothetical protein
VVRQYSLARIAAIWAAATVPMALLGRVVAPALAADPALPGMERLAAMTVGLIGQFCLVVFLLHREGIGLRWSEIRRSLWLSAPRSPRTGSSQKFLWLWLLPLLALTAAYQFLGAPYVHDLWIGLFPFLAEPAGYSLAAFFRGSGGTHAAGRCVGCPRTVLGIRSVQYRHRRGVAVSRTVAAPNAGRVRRMRLARQRYPLRTVPLESTMDHPWFRNSRGSVLRIPHKTVSVCLVWNRRPLGPERVLPGPHSRPGARSRFQPTARYRPLLPGRSRGSSKRSPSSPCTPRRGRKRGLKRPLWIRGRRSPQLACRSNEGQSWTAMHGTPPDRRDEVGTRRSVLTSEGNAAGEEQRDGSS